MNSYYEEKLYPLQDKVFSLLQNEKLPFYLTGGTALHRGYYHVRYSDDLDFFVNDAPDFQSLQDKVLKTLKNLSFEVNRRTNNFMQLIIAGELQIDFVNDVPAYYGEVQNRSVYYRVDNVINILANKLGALINREEVKDVVDIWIIWQKNKVNWQEIFIASRSKAAGIYPPHIAAKIDEMPEGLLEKIKFTKKTYPEQFRSEKEELISSILSFEK